MRSKNGSAPHHISTLTAKRVFGVRPGVALESNVVWRRRGRIAAKPAAEASSVRRRIVVMWSRLPRAPFRAELGAAARDAPHGTKATRFRRAPAIDLLGARGATH
jgi:hypothetical protein